MNIVRSTSVTAAVPLPARFSRSEPEPDPDPEETNPFARLVEIMRDMDDLLGRLAIESDRLARARAFLADPRSNDAFGDVIIDFITIRISDLFDRLHANRVEAHAIIDFYTLRMSGLLGRLRANRAEALGILRASRR